MKNPVGSESATSKKAERPSLYDGAPGAGHASEAFSILDALDAPAKKSRLVKWMLVLIVIALFGTTLVLYTVNKTGVSSAGQFELGTFIQLLSINSEKEVPDGAKAAGSLSSMNFAGPSPTTQTDIPQLAKTEAVFPPSSTPSGKEQPAAMVLEASVAEPFVIKGAGALATVAEPIAEPAAVPTARTAQQESHQKARPEMSKPVRHKFPSTDRSSAKSSRTPAPHVQGKKNDRDVDLIAALLSHVGVAGRNQREPASVPARKTNTRSREGFSEPSLTTGGAADSGRDVVLPSPGDTTGALVKRCQALGFFEGQLCRFRICSGHWGKDPACPANSLDRSDS